jgi:hypothetical protein
MEKVHRGWSSQEDDNEEWLQTAIFSENAPDLFRFFPNSFDGRHEAIHIEILFAEQSIYIELLW